MERVTKKVQGLTVSDYGVIPVNIEVTIEQGIGIHFLGVPDSYAKEGLLRIITALEATGHHCPGQRVIINISAKWPRDMRSIRWVLLEAAVTYGLICAIDGKQPDDKIRCGEMGLNGLVKPRALSMTVRQHRLLCSTGWLPKIKSGVEI